MPEITRTVYWLSLFMPLEKAREIEGDMLEQRSADNRVLHCLHVIQLCLQFGWRSFVKQPVLSVLCAYASYELLAKFYLWVALPSSRYVRFKLDVPQWFSELYDRGIWVVASVVTGMLICRLIPQERMPVVGGTLALVLLRVILTGETSLFSVLSYMVLPMLAGVLLSHAMTLHSKLDAIRLTTGSV